MSTFSQAHADHLDPDSHCGGTHPPEEAPSEFTIHAKRDAASASWSVTCPEWRCTRSVTDAELAGEIAKLARDIGQYGEECGWSEPPLPAPAQRRIGATAIQRAVSAIATAKTYHASEFPVDRHAAVGLVLVAIEALIEEATRVRRIAVAAGNDASALANGGKPD